jgi:DNA modification methylase
MIRLLPGDCREVLATLPANSVHCVVTSPPYYGLRDYGVAGQIGLEATPDAYLAEMVGVFREVKRVLRPDGTCWVNMGDSYNTYAGNRGASKSISANTNEAIPSLPQGAGLTTPSLANKQLLMMPARLALALQADGWWLRSDIIWHKPNPMPESVTDRPTSAHEHVFLLAKSARYFYDADAVREEPTGRTDAIRSFGVPPDRQDNGRSFELDGMKGRNCRNVWTIATAPFSQSHFATMPPAVVERCIRAGTSERGCCAACGAPWGRVVERSVAFTSGSGKTGNVPNGKHAGTVQALSGEYDIRMGPSVATTTTGWAPSCACAADVVPAVVLDPFGGAGTTALVADRLQRDAILIELNPDYTRMAMDRCRDDAPLFAEPSPPPAEPPDAPRIRDLFA